MKKIKIGLAREGKVPPDNRVTLTPWEIIETQNLFSGLEVYCQTSNIRCFSDESYRKLQIPVIDSLDNCAIIMGIKEFPVEDLLEGKTYFFFSHTIKKQPYNRRLLQEILKKNITLVDYECLTDIHGKRVLAFGRYAGIVGAYNGLLGYGLKYDLFELARAFRCDSYALLKQEYKKILLPPIKILLTGHGSVGHGAREVLEGAGIKEVTASDYLMMEFREPVFVQLHSRDYYKRYDYAEFDREEFHRSPHYYKSDFLKYARKTDLMINGTYWNMGSERMLSMEDLQGGDVNIKMIADISCDIDGPIPATIRNSTIKEPFYDFNPYTKEEAPPFSSENHITVMAIDNLPNELPKESSNSFGRVLIEKIFPNLVYGDEDEMIKRATITSNGKLTSRYRYLQDFVEEKE